LAVWAACLVAQGSSPKPPPSRTPPPVEDVTLTGCVQEGTDAGVYILTNAVNRGESKDLPRTFRLVSNGEELDFTLHANHQVNATGRAELKSPSDGRPGGRIDPRDLPTLAVKTIQTVSERCVSTAEK
jgi:hypothetical protein